MILVNGTKGIGSGYSTEVLSYNPEELIVLLKDLLNGRSLSLKLVPWYRHFKGTIQQKDSKVITFGSYEISKTTNTKLMVTELPVKKWTEKYYDTLHGLEDSGMIRSYKNKCSEKDILFELTFKDSETLQKLKKGDTIVDQLDLYSKFSLTNMNLFTHNSSGVSEIKHFDNAEDILKEYFSQRLTMYNTRKEFQLKTLKKDIDLLQLKLKFISLYLENSIKIAKVPEEEIISQLKSNSFPLIKGTYDYLLGITLKSLTKEKLLILQNEIDNKNSIYSDLNSTPIEKIWENELDILSDKFRNFL
jgi:DNA topoisomerase-2